MDKGQLTRFGFGPGSSSGRRQRGGSVSRWLTLALQLLAVVLLTPLALNGCADLHVEKSKGELVLALQTDMSVPKDIDTLHVEVTVDGEQVHNEDFVIAPEGDVKLPKTMVLTAGDKFEPAVEAIVVGLLRGNARVFGQVKTTIPRDRRALVRIPIQWLCDGSATVLEDGSYASTCEPQLGEDRVCVAGNCVDPTIPENLLPTYSPEEVYGGGSKATDPLAQCFPTAECFDVGIEVSPDENCIVEVDVHPEEALNLGLRIAKSGEDGICGLFGCYIPLDQSELLGWYPIGEMSDAGVRRVRARLPTTACAKLDAGDVDAVIASFSCETKLPRYPTCGEWSAVEGVTVVINALQSDGGAGQADAAAIPSDAASDQDAADAQQTPSGVIMISAPQGGSTLSPDETVQLTIPGVNPADITWASNNPKVATVDENGNVTAVGPGTVVITAEVAGEIASFEITVGGEAEPDVNVEDDAGVDFVIERPAVTLAISPSANSVPEGVSVRLKAIASFADGQTGDVSALTTWESADDSIVTVDSAGLATGVALGTTEVTATYGDAQATATFYVNNAELEAVYLMPTVSTLPVGLTTQLRAMASFSNGTTLDVTQDAQWATTDDSVASVSQDGNVTAQLQGMATVSASFGGLKGEADITVSDAELLSIMVTGADAALPVGLDTQLTATASYSDGVTLNVTSQVAWSSSDETVLTIDEAGIAVALREGNASVSAELGGVEGQLPLGVTSAILETLSISPVQAELSVGLTQQFLAQGSYSDGSTVDVTGNVTWTSNAVQVLQVDGAGLASALAEGDAIVTATLGAVTDSANVTVNSAELVSLAVNPPSTVLPAGLTRQLSVMGSYTDGSSVDVTAQVVWGSGSVAVVTVDGTGLATAVAEGNTQVTASLGSISAQASFQVTSAVLEAVAITPAGSSMAVGRTRQLSASASYSDGSTLDVTSTAIWASQDVAIATVNAGLVTGGSIGATRVTATLAGVTGLADITVTDALVELLTITPGVVNVPEGTTATFTATASYSDGSSVDVSSEASWTSASNTIATVDDSGVVTGQSAGGTQVTATLDGVSANANVNVTDAVVEVLTVTPATVSLADGRTHQLTATASYSDGSSAVVTDTVTWRSGSTLVASVNSSGLVTAEGVGNTNIFATLSGVQGSAAVTVTDAVLEQLAVTPADVSIAEGYTRQLTATASYSDGSSVDVSSEVSWTSSDNSVVTVSATGLASAEGTGSTTVRATLDGVSGVANFTVNDAVVELVTVTPERHSLPEGHTVQLTATASLSNGTSVDVTDQVTWVSSSNTVATVTQAGLVTARAAGDANVTASLGTLSDSALITVTDAVVESVTVTPSSVSLAAGRTRQLTAMAAYSDGSSVNVTSTATWRTGSSSVASVSAAGLLTAAGVGTTNVTAEMGGIQGSTSVTVTSAVLELITVTPGDVSLADGYTRQLTATASYSDGSSVDVSSEVAWTSTNNAVVTVSAAGLVTAESPGVASVRATLDNVTGQASFTVNDAVVELVTVTPSTNTLAAGRTTQLTATASLSNGTSIDVTQSANWSSSSNAVVTVSSSGLATAAGVGTATVQATHAGVSGQSDFTVTSAVVDGITVSPVSATLAEGYQQQLSAVVSYSDGSSVDQTGSVTWLSGSNAVATVNNAGLVTAAGQGQTQVTASIGSFAASSAITVDPAVVESLAITPSSTTLADGHVQQLTVIATMSNGTLPDVTNQVTWTSGSNSVVTVSNTGLVTAEGQGATQVTATLDSLSVSASFTVTAAVVESLSLTPASSTLPAGYTQQLTATATMSNGTTPDVTYLMTWSSGNNNVATVTGVGLVTAIGAGQTTITGSYLGVQATASFTVTAAVIENIVVSPNPASVADGLTVSLGAVAEYSDTSTRDVTSEATWRSANNSIASVDTGVVTGQAQGQSTTITASIGNISGAATVNVGAPEVSSIRVSPSAPSAPVGETVQLTATAVMTNGDENDVTAQTSWTPQSQGIVSISSAGVAQATAVGSTYVIATYGGASTQFAFTSSPPVLTGLTAAPSSVNIATGTTANAAITATYSDGSTADVTGSVTWSSSNVQVATVSAGVISGVSQGSANVTAALGNLTAVVAVTVGAPVIQSIELRPATSQLRLGSTLQLSVAVTLSDGSSGSLSAGAVWQSSSPQVASVSGAVVTGNAQGTATISVTDAGVTGSASVTVIVPTLAVVPNSASLAVGESLTLALQATWPGSPAPEDVTQSASWATADTDVIDLSGPSVGAIAEGSALVAATYLGIEADADILVSGGILTSLRVTPTSAEFPVGTWQDFQAYGVYSDAPDQEVNVTSNVTWSETGSSLSSLGGGRFSAVATGGAGVIADLDGLEAAVDVNVPNWSLQGMRLTPNPLRIQVGGSGQMYAIASFVDAGVAFDYDVTEFADWVPNSGAPLQVDAGRVRHTGSTTGGYVVNAYFGNTGSEAGVDVGPYIVVNPDPVQLVVGSSLQLQVTLVSPNGQQDVTSSSEFTISSQSVASVDARGFVTAQDNGTTTLTVLFPELKLTRYVTVTTTNALNFDSIAIQPSTVSLFPGESAAVRLYGKLPSGTTLDITNASGVDWYPRRQDQLFYFIDPKNVIIVNANAAQGQTASFEATLDLGNTTLKDSASLVVLTGSPAVGGL